MDVNLTGALAANISLMQGSTAQYSFFNEQIITTLLTAGVTLGAVVLTHYLTTKYETRKRDLEEKEKWLESRKDAYGNFLDVFSMPIGSDQYDLEFSSLTKDHLEAALRAVEFGDEPANPIIILKLSGEEKKITSLRELIKFILELRYRTDLRHIERNEIFHLLRIGATDRFSSSFLETMTSK